MNSFLENQELQRRRELKKHYVFYDNSLPTVTWDEVIFCLNHNVMHGELIKKLKNFGIVLHKSEMHKNVSDVLTEFSKLNQDKKATAHFYISLTEKSETFGWHTDNTEVIFWQAIGKTSFSIKEDDQIFEYELNKNSMIYLPKQIPHSTKPLTPRVGISMGFQ